MQRAGALRFLPETGTATLASLYNYFCPLQKRKHKIRLPKDRRSSLGAHGAEKASPLLQRVRLARIFRAVFVRQTPKSAVSHPGWCRMRHNCRACGFCVNRMAKALQSSSRYLVQTVECTGTGLQGPATALFRACAMPPMTIPNRLLCALGLCQTLDEAEVVNQSNRKRCWSTALQKLLLQSFTVEA